MATQSKCKRTFRFSGPRCASLRLPALRERHMWLPSFGAAACNTYEFFLQTKCCRIHCDSRQLQVVRNGSGQHQLASMCYCVPRRLFYDSLLIAMWCPVCYGWRASERLLTSRYPNQSWLFITRFYRSREAMSIKNSCVWGCIYNDLDCIIYTDHQ